MRTYNYKVSIIILTFCLLIQFVPSIQNKLKSIKNNFVIVSKASTLNYTNIVRHDNELSPLRTFIQSNIKNTDINYIYIDNPDEQGTMNYYRLRYLLAPAKFVKYSYYGYSSPTEELYINLINKFNVDYIIVRDNNNFIKLLDQKFIGKQNLILKITNKSANTLNGMLKEVK